MLVYLNAATKTKGYAHTCLFVIVDANTYLKRDAIIDIQLVPAMVAKVTRRSTGELRVLGHVKL
ncbi:hypothetical protein HanPSC8_Chr14g0598021 [Helianthus annuus]|nr:hypothetical protein HanPSC8_Chr14g0598021 [Helianthus annuus]